MFLNFPVWSENAYGTLDSIDFPKVIRIPKNFNKEMDVSYKINYIYMGKTIVSEVEHRFSYDYVLEYSPIGTISYLTRNGKPLPEAMKFFKKRGLGGNRMNAKIGGAYNSVEPLLIKGEKESIEIKVLSPGIFKNTDIDEAIAEKSLSMIRISIDMVKVDWKYLVSVRKGKDHIQEGEFYINVNKTIEIKVRYEDEKDEM
jgi:hypothetical protein